MAGKSLFRNVEKKFRKDFLQVRPLKSDIAKKAREMGAVGTLSNSDVKKAKKQLRKEATKKLNVKKVVSKMARETGSIGRSTIEKAKKKLNY